MTVNNETYWSTLSASMVDKIIGDEFQLLEVLGHGAYGCLFLGQSQLDMSYAAVKVLSKTGLNHDQLRLQQLEIDIQTSLNHHHLLKLHRVIQDNDYIYMVMELCDGGDLFDYVANGEPVSESSIKKLFSQILDAVQSMHNNGVYHRDIKLENILLVSDEDEDDMNCKVADFGLATRERYSTEFGCGSTSYLAPEHFDDEESDIVPYDSAASDIWSLGILLLGMMFGRNPWSEASITDATYMEFKRSPIMLKDQLFPDMSMSTFRLLCTALAPNGAKRPSIAEFREQFLAIDHLFDDEQEEEEFGPVSIPSKFATDAASYDSAYFSGAATSFEDLIEEEIMEDHFCKLDLASQASNDDDIMFAHSGEDWWL
ncbi:kinase-like protein [Backusella circina FSU 941]|nr:kinase-like protein [Backusella circina FSU 941]